MPTEKMAKVTVSDCRKKPTMKPMPCPHPSASALAPPSLSQVPKRKTTKDVQQRPRESPERASRFAPGRRSPAERVDISSCVPNRRGGVDPRSEPQSSSEHW